MVKALSSSQRHNDTRAGATLEPSAPLRVLLLFLPIVRLQYPFVALRGHILEARPKDRCDILEARLKDRCLLFRQNRPLEYLLQNLVDPLAGHQLQNLIDPLAGTVQRIGLRSGCNGRLKSGRLSGTRWRDGTWRIEPAELQ